MFPPGTNAELLGGLSGNEGSTPLILAVNGNHYDTAVYLMEQGCDVHVSNKNGYSSLLSACFLGHVLLVTELVNRKADVNQAQSAQGWTPLGLAASKGHVEVARILLDLGNASVDTANVFGETPLMLAADSGNDDMVNLLIKRKASMDEVSRDGLTAFQIARKRGHKVVASILKVNGCKTGKVRRPAAGSHVPGPATQQPGGGDCSIM